MKATFKNFEINAVYTGAKMAQWGGNTENWNHHNITVKNTDNGLKCRFDFWSSIAHPDMTEEYDVLNAFYCFVSDSISGKMNFEEFCGEFGYDTDSMTANKTWKSCKKSTEKLERIYNGDMYDLANELQEVAG